MVRDHEAVNKQALALLKKLNVTPEDNDTSKTLTKNATEKCAVGKARRGSVRQGLCRQRGHLSQGCRQRARDDAYSIANNADLKSLLQTRLKIFRGEQHAEHVAHEGNAGRRCLDNLFRSASAFGQAGRRREQVK
jgi:putative membrane protein